MLRTEIIRNCLPVQRGDHLSRRAWNSDVVWESLEFLGNSINFEKRWISYCYYHSCQLRVYQGARQSDIAVYRQYRRRHGSDNTAKKWKLIFEKVILRIVPNTSVQLKLTNTYHLFFLFVRTLAMLCASSLKHTTFWIPNCNETHISRVPAVGEVHSYLCWVRYHTRLMALLRSKDVQHFGSNCDYCGDPAHGTTEYCTCNLKLLFIK